MVLQKPGKITFLQLDWQERISCLHLENKRDERRQGDKRRFVKAFVRRRTSAAKKNPTSLLYELHHIWIWARECHREASRLIGLYSAAVKQPTARPSETHQATRWPPPWRWGQPSLWPQSENKAALPLSEAEREIMNHFSHKKHTGEVRGKVAVFAVPRTHGRHSLGSTNIGPYCVPTTTWKKRGRGYGLLWWRCFCRADTHAATQSVQEKKQLVTDNKSLSDRPACTFWSIWGRANRKLLERRGPFNKVTVDHTEQVRATCWWKAKNSVN